MKSALPRLISVNSNYYSFMSGVLAGVSINIYTSVFGDQVPERAINMLVSSLLTLVSAICWMLIAWKIDNIEKVMGTAVESEISINKLRQELLKSNTFRLTWLFSVALLTTVGGLIVLAIR